jgi:accessory gene regulator B
MKKYLLDQSINIIKKYNKNISDLEIDKIRYGLEGIYLTITKFFIISLITLYIGIFKEFIIFTFFYNVIRVVAFGLHASKSYICLITSSLIFISLPGLAIVMNINLILKGCFCLLALIIMILYAPADTKKRPLLKAKKRIKLKAYSIIITIIYIAIIMLFNNDFLSNVILLSLLTESALIMPITYKIFKMPYKNYKTYRYKFN